MPSNQINFEPVFSTSCVASTKDSFKLSVLYTLPVRGTPSSWSSLASVPCCVARMLLKMTLLLNLEKGERINETDLQISERTHLSDEGPQHIWFQEIQTEHVVLNSSRVYQHAG
jgi:hypothetical protein